MPQGRNLAIMAMLAATTGPEFHALQQSGRMMGDAGPRTADFYHDRISIAREQKDLKSGLPIYPRILKDPTPHVSHPRMPIGPLCGNDPFVVLNSDQRRRLRKAHIENGLPRRRYGRLRGGYLHKLPGNRGPSLAAIKREEKANALAWEKERLARLAELGLVAG